MQNNEKDIVKEKVNFYYSEQLKCHVSLIPTGFINGFFRSLLIEGTYYWFEDERKPNEKIRLFLYEIYDVEDYKDRRVCK